MIDKYIEVFKVKYLPKLIDNKKYYDTKNVTINNRAFTDITKPNNKIATSWSRYITILINGYFIGKPVTYQSQNKDFVDLITKYKNKEDSHNQAIGKDCSIYGLSAELLFLDENKQVDFAKLNPQTVIPIYSNDINGDLLYCIRYWEEDNIVNDEKITHIEVYSNESIKYYEKNKNGITLIKEDEHYFKQVPINIFYNNEDMTGDAECVHKLIDGYDLSLSDTSNFREELNDSYLVFKNTNLENEDIITMKQNRIIQIEDSSDTGQSSVNWLNKDSNDSENENYKNRLAEDIKRFSFVADIESAKSHTTATSAKIGLIGIEQIVSEKEDYFRNGLIRRLKLICNIYNLYGNDFTVDDVKITFVRNIPIDLSVTADAISKFRGLVSDESLLEQIPFISDIELEKERIQKQNELNSYSNLFNTEGDIVE